MDFCFKSKLPVSSETAYRWHARRGALERLTPPWVRMIPAPKNPDSPLFEGARVKFELLHGWVKHRWECEHFDLYPGKEFNDRQIRGPFAEWKHRHRFSDTTEGCVLEDRISCRFPRWLSNPVSKSYLQGELNRLFVYRHEITMKDLNRYGSFSGLSGKRILISGHRGLIGRRLSGLLRMLGADVLGLTRSPHGENEFRWDPIKGTLDPDALNGVDAVIHLAGENIASGRWTAERRQRILESRKLGTRLLAENIARQESPPGVFVSAAGTGLYPSDGTLSDESSDGGTGFLAEVSREWESAADPARRAGIRVVHARMGIVLSPEGGALGLMLPAFKMGLGGRIGSGCQYMSWIAIDDVVDILIRLIVDSSFSGPVNLVAPGAVTQQEFTRTLAGVLRRPAVFPVPATVLCLLLGEMARETILADIHAAPRVLQDRGYDWRYPDLERALRFLLGRKVSSV